MPVLARPVSVKNLGKSSNISRHINLHLQRRKYTNFQQSAKRSCPYVLFAKSPSLLFGCSLGTSTAEKHRAEKRLGLLLARFIISLGNQAVARITLRESPSINLYQYDIYSSDDTIMAQESYLSSKRVPEYVIRYPSIA